MKLKPCPSCGRMPKIFTDSFAFKYGTEVRPFVHAKAIVDISCSCGLYKCVKRDVIIDVPEETYLSNRRASRNTHKAIIERILEEEWNRRTDNG